ncbi:hypothetical protein GGR49_002603 [Sphingomonas carotinifaciens]|nr:hypothetical protein [Sphingomonas carotinifaciens]
MQHKVPGGADDEEALTDDIVALARQYGRYGYRRVTALLHAADWSVNHKRVERIRRREGLKVPQRQPKCGRLWLNDGSCIRLRPEYPKHIWAKPPTRLRRCAAPLEGRRKGTSLSGRRRTTDAISAS